MNDLPPNPTDTARAIADGVVVVGGGQAGGRCIEALRQGGFAGAITLVGAETHLPYERPPLSKEYLAAGDPAHLAWVRPDAWWDEQNITRHLGNPVVAIDRAARSVRLTDGHQISYGALVLATGARPRTLDIPGADHPACHTIRTIEDSQRLLPILQAGEPIVVIGAGFIGLEVAAAACAHHCPVSVVEQAGRVLTRGVPADIAAWYAELHRAHGVDLHLGARITAITDTAGRPTVHLADGTALPAAMVVVGIGVVPEVGLAASAGLAVENGILVDRFCRTADPAIYAAGDVACQDHPILARRLRLEAWANAQNQAIAVARNILGQTTSYADIPWFWSDQFGHNLQIAGIVDPADMVITRGVPGEGPLLQFHLHDGAIAAAIGIDAGREMRAARELIARGTIIAPDLLADTSRKIADLAKAAKAAATPA